MHSLGSEAQKTLKKKKILSLNDICICDIHDLCEVYVQACIEAKKIFLTASPSSSLLQNVTMCFFFAGKITRTLQILLEVIPAEEDQKS